MSKEVDQALFEEYLDYLLLERRLSKATIEVYAMEVSSFLARIVDPIETINP